MNFRQFNKKLFVGSIALAGCFTLNAQAEDVLPEAFVDGAVLTAEQLNNVRTEVNKNADNVSAVNGVVNTIVSQSQCGENKAIQNISEAGAVTCVDVVDPVGSFAPVDHNHDENYYTKSELDNTFTKKVSNFATNPNFLTDALGWVLGANSSSDLELVTVNNAPFSNRAVQNQQDQTLWTYNENKITIDHKQTYEVKGSFQKKPGGSTGSIYLAVLLFDENGDNIARDGTWWYYPVSGYVPPSDDAWTEYKAQFGAGTNNLFPIEAVTATVGFILNYNGQDNPGDRTFQAQGLSIHTSKPNSQWADLELINGFVNWGRDDHQTAQYRKTGDRVCLRGLVESTNVTSNIAFLPPTFRPPMRLLFGTGGRPHDRIDIHSSGAIELISNTNNWASLDGICFSTSS